MADYVTLLGAEGVERAGHQVSSAAETIQNAASSMSWSLEQHQRALEEHARALGELAELQALTALVNQHAAATHADAVQYGAQQCAPDYRAARKLAELLEARGVLPKLPEPKPDDEVVPW